MGAPAPVGDRPSGDRAPGDRAGAQEDGARGDGRDPIATEQVSPFALLRSKGRIRSTICFVGPAFVAAVAYIDPGNFATNFAAGAHFGYTLIWVVVLANLMAMLVQYQSAKVGVVTGKDLPELCRDRFPRQVSVGLWIQAEVVAMATDIAEFVGAALGLYLLFGVPLLPAGLITAVVAFVILALQQRGYRRFEIVIVGLLGLVLLGFAYDLIAVGADPVDIAGGLVPSFAGADSLVLATGIVGATVMPHVVYLHSALTKGRVGCRDVAERRQLLRFQRLDVLLALGVAGAINVTMLVVAASLFHGSGTRGRRLDRGRPRRSGPAGRGRGRPRVRGRPARLRASRPRASAPTPGRSSCRASSGDGSRCSYAPDPHHAARPDRARRRATRDRHADRVAGTAVLRHPVRPRSRWPTSRATAPLWASS